MQVTSSAVDTSKLRLIAFYLTQFHPVPENDEWWGKGFTEWTNVTKAEPLFPGHYQPHLPTDLGYYDLRVRETRRDQIALAKRYGIDGFCYHYYWFSGRRILERPLEDMLGDPGSDMPFCLCWANENWTRRWDAAEHEVLLAQKYGPDDDLNIIKDLARFFADPRYIRHEGAPLLIVYRPQQIPDPKKTVRVWREYCRSVGIGEIHICSALTHGNRDYVQFGFDSAVEFPPHAPGVKNENHRIPFNRPFTGWALEYAELARDYLDRSYPSPNVFKTVFPSWDNTARTGSRALMMLDATPANYRRWLAEAIDQTCRKRPARENLVFVNAWNEWAEGCHLEPDRKWGHQFLQATLEARRAPQACTAFDRGQVDAIRQQVPVRRLRTDLAEVYRHHRTRAEAGLRARAHRFPRLRRWIRRGVDAALFLRRPPSGSASKR